MSTAGKVIKCKAQVTWDKDVPPVLEEIEVDPPQKDEVRVKIIAAGVCHSDWSANNGNIVVPYPVVLGHEGAGVIESVGEGVTSLKAGDHVLTTFIPQCRKCRTCTEFSDRNLCDLCHEITFKGTAIDGKCRFRCKGKPIYYFNGVGCFSEYTVLHISNACKVDPKAPLDKVCLLSCAVSTGYGAALKTAKVFKGATCAVWGLGGIGLATVMGCKAAGAKKIYCIDINPAKAEYAKVFGMTDFLNPKDYSKPISEVLIELTNGGVDFAFDCVGTKALVEMAFASIHPAFGVCVIVGVSPSTQRISFEPIQVMFGKQIIGTFCGGWKGLDDAPVLVEKYMKKELLLDEFVTNKMPLDALKEAYQMMLDGKTLRTVLDVGTL